MDLTIHFLRHGKADKKLPNHREHPLSPEGQAQAAARREQLGRPTYDLVICSDLPRTEETARIVSGLNGDCDVITVVPQLFGSEEDPRIKATNAAFEKLGHAPLREYYKLDKLQEIIESLASDAYKAINGHLDRLTRENGDTPTKALAVGHGLLLQAIVRQYGRESCPPNLLDAVLGECQGFEVVIKDESLTVNPLN